MRLKKLGAAVLAAAALSAVLASSAFATATPTEVNWQKWESPYQTLVTEPLAVTTGQVGNATFAFNYEEQHYAISATNTECLECRITNSPSGGSGTGRLKFTGVTVVEPKSCTTPSTITTEPLSFSARYKEGEAELVKFEPAYQFFRLELEGSGACLPNEFQVKGSLFGRFSNKPGVQAITQGVEFSPSINAAAGGLLTFRGSGVGSLTATEVFTAGGMPFGVAPGGVILPEATPTAAKWYTGATEGGVTELVGSQAVTAEQVGSSTLTTTFSGYEVVLHTGGAECLECQITNSPSGGSGTGKLKFTEIWVDKPAGCTTASTIKTNPLTLAANWVQGEAALVKVTPKSGEESGFATFELSGPGCPVHAAIVPKGSLFGKLSTKPGVPATSQTVEFRPGINGNAGGNFHVGTQLATWSATDVFKAGGLFFGIK